MSTMNSCCGWGAWAASLAFLVPTVLWAEPPDQDPVTSGESRVDEAPPQLITLKFAGGSAADYVEVIRNTGAKPNVVINDTRLLAAVQVPPVALESVTVQGALSILEKCQGRDDQGREIELFSSFEQGKEPVRGGWTPQGAAIYQITAKSHGPFSKMEMILRVFSLESVRAGGVQDDDVLSAVEAALTLSGAGLQVAQLKFHAETGLLLVRGTPEQVGAIDEVVDQLKRQSGKDQQEQVNKANQELQDCKDQVAKLQQIIDNVKTQRELGM